MVNKHWLQATGPGVDWELLVYLISSNTPVKRVEISSALFVKGILQFPHVKRRDPPMCCRNIRPMTITGDKTITQDYKKHQDF